MGLLGNHRRQRAGDRLALGVRQEYLRRAWVGDLWTSVGRLTGLLSAYLALIQVLLLARLPWLERILGFDPLTVWHRFNGKVCLYLVLAHVVFITIGYASIDQVGIMTEVSRLLTGYPGMIAATIGTVLLIAVVVSSLVLGAALAIVTYSAGASPARPHDRREGSGFSSSSPEGVVNL